MKIEIINTASAEFKKAVELGDANAKTLGFLPYVAFEKYAQKEQLIGAFDKSNSELLGYLLYRTSYDKITIVHLCIDDKHRNKGVAKKLVDYLKKHTEKYKGIRLSCRNDYGINHIWENFNFIPIYEKAGRSKAGHKLTIWWYPHQQKDLFSQIDDYELKNKTSVVMDMNIFLDLKDHRNVESLALQSDWLSTEINLYITRELFIEINRNENDDLKESSRTFAANFDLLPFFDEDYTQIFEELKLKINIQSPNDRSDLKHIAYAISGGAEYFITRDEFILENKETFLEYGVNIYRPSEFITHYDEHLQSSKYKPQKLIGTNISTTNISSQNVDAVISMFRTNHERKSHLKEKIRAYLSHPQDYALITVSKDDKIISLIVLDRTQNNKLIVPVFRFLTSKIKETLAKHMLFKIIDIATKENRAVIEITETPLEKNIEIIISETKFLKDGTNWQKVNVKGVLTKSDTLNKLEGFTEAETIITKIKNEYKTTIENDTLLDYTIERSLFPLKIKDLEIPTFIVPIKSHWAEALFDDKSKGKLFAEEPNYILLLNRENVYYRSSDERLKSPARILWYISENKHSKEKGHIKACSYIDAIFIDKPKVLFKRFKELGVYEWNDVKQTAGKKENIMSFVFSDTELFDIPVSINYIQKLFTRAEGKKFMVASPMEIKKETYIDIYIKGMKL